MAYAVCFILEIFGYDYRSRSMKFVNVESLSFKIIKHLYVTGEYQGGDAKSQIIGQDEFRSSGSRSERNPSGGRCCSRPLENPGLAICSLYLNSSCITEHNLDLNLVGGEAPYYSGCWHSCRPLGNSNRARPGSSQTQSCCASSGFAHCPALGALVLRAACFSFSTYILFFSCSEVAFFCRSPL